VADMALGGLLASWSQECKHSILQDIRRLPGGYHSLLICAWTWCFSWARKQTCRNKLIQKELSVSRQIFWDWE